MLQRLTREPGFHNDNLRNNCLHPGSSFIRAVVPKVGPNSHELDWSEPARTKIENCCIVSIQGGVGATCHSTLPKHHSVSQRTGLVRTCTNREVSFRFNPRWRVCVSLLLALGPQVTVPCPNIIPSRKAKYPVRGPQASIGFASAIMPRWTDSGAWRRSGARPISAGCSDLRSAQKVARGCQRRCGA